MQGDYGFFFINGSLGSRRFGKYFTEVDFGKVNVFGLKYAVEYVVNRSREDEEERIYKVYVTESIRLRNENKCITAKFTDLIDFDNFRNEKSAEEVKRDILEEFKRLGGESNSN